MFGSASQTGRFRVNNIPVSGVVREQPTGLGFYIWQDKTSPASLARLNRIANHERLELSADIPLLRHSRLVEIGMLTAAYLLWFREAGYSWVFQDHLDVVRQQICQPERDVIGRIPIAKIHQSGFEDPWIGVIDFGDTAFAAAGFSGYSVFLPSFSAQNPWKFMESMTNSDVSATYQRLRFADGHQFKKPFMIVFKNNGIMASEMLANTGKDYVVLAYDGVNTVPSILTPTDQKTYRTELEAENTIEIHVSPG